MGLILLDNIPNRAGFSNIKVGNSGGMGVGVPAPGSGGPPPALPDGINTRVSQVSIDVMTTVAVVNPTVRTSQVSIEVMSTVP